MLIVIHFNSLRLFFYIRGSKLRPAGRIRPGKLCIRLVKPFSKLRTAGQIQPANTFCK